MNRLTRGLRFRLNPIANRTGCAQYAPRSLALRPKPVERVAKHPGLL